MAVSWPLTPTVSPTPAPSTADRTSAARPLAEPAAQAAARLREIALSPVTGLVAMFLGLALLFGLPMVGLPFVAVVVLPAVIYHLQSERRPRYRSHRD